MDGQSFLGIRLAFQARLQFWLEQHNFGVDLGWKATTRALGHR